jgi:hypothetical protein
MKGLLEHLDRREPATPLALFRMALGLSMIGSLLSMIRAGVLPLLWTDRPYGGYRPLPGDHWMVELLAGPSDAAVLILVGLGLIGGLFLVLGFGSRITPLVSLGVISALLSLNPDTVGPRDHLLPAGLLLLVLAPATATLSLDARLFGDGFRSQLPRPAWVRDLAIAQLLLFAATDGSLAMLASASVLLLSLLSGHRLDLRVPGALILAGGCLWDWFGGEAPGALLPVVYLPVLWGAGVWEGWVSGRRGQQ